MKKILLSLILTLIFYQSHSQDLIVTTKGDSLQCKIVSIKHNNIYYHTDVSDSETLPKVLPLEQIEKYKYDYCRPKNNDYQNLVLSLNGGYSQRLAEVSTSLPDDYAEHIEHLKKGYHLGVDFAYYFSEYFGIGAKYMFFTASNVHTVKEYDAFGITYDNIRVEDETTIPYIGLVVSTRFYDTPKKGSLLINYSLGYFGYTDDGTYGKQSYTIKGHTLGWAFDLGYDYWISNNAAFGVRLSLMSGTLKECTKEAAATLNSSASKEKIKLKKDEYEGLGRLDISVGLRFGK